MPRIAVLADIHANVPALDAVLADIASQDVDEIVVAGDLVGRGPLGSAVVRRVRALDAACVRGNHEDYLLDFRAGRVPADWRADPAWACARWMADELSDADAAYLDGLPLSCTPRLAPDIRIVHGTPLSNREGIGPWTTDEQLAVILADVAEPVLVCAHTHRPLVRTIGAQCVVNTGSVGLPFNGDARAQYVVLDAGDRAHGADRWRAEHRYVAYDRDLIRSIYRETGFLAAGGIISALLALELETARSVLVPYLSWVEKRGAALGWDSTWTFLDEAGWTAAARAAGIAEHGTVDERRPVDERGSIDEHGTIEETIEAHNIVEAHDMMEENNILDVDNMDENEVIEENTGIVA